MTSRRAEKAEKQNRKEAKKQGKTEKKYRNIMKQGRAEKQTTEADILKKQTGKAKDAKEKQRSNAAGKVERCT